MAYLIVEMRHQGIERVRVSVDWTSDQATAAMVPDRSQWLKLWMESPAVGANSIKKLLSKLDCQEPLDMLSCVVCILGDSRMEHYSTAALASARDAITEVRQQMRQGAAFQDEGHPAVIVQTVMSTLEGHQ